MLYQELPGIESGPLDGWMRWLAPALVGAAALSAALLALLLSTPAVAGAIVLIGAGGALFAYVRAPAARPLEQPLVDGPDYALVGSALAAIGDPVALTTGDGALLLVNAAYRDRFGNRPPMDLAANEDAVQGLKLAQTMAWRDGAGCVAGIETTKGSTPVEVDRVGTGDNLLMWRFARPGMPDPITMAANRLRGRSGDLLGRAGVLAAFVDPQGKVIAYNRQFEARALSGHARGEDVRLTDLVNETEEENHFQLVAEGDA